MQLVTKYILQFYVSTNKLVLYSLLIHLTFGKNLFW